MIHDIKNQGMSSFANQWGKNTSQSEPLTKETNRVRNVFQILL